LIPDRSDPAFCDYGLRSRFDLAAARKGSGAAVMVSVRAHG